ncbi:hypothetical protein ABPG74_000004 [Tetrahymena malaccensis]
MYQDNLSQTKQYYQSDECSVSRDEINSNNSLANSSLNSLNTLQLHLVFDQENKSLVVFPLEKKKQIRKPTNTISTKKQQKAQTKSFQNESLSKYLKQKEDLKKLSQVCNYQEDILEAQSLHLNNQDQQFNISNQLQKNVSIALIPYQIRSKQKFQLSSCQIINMDWFSYDPHQIFDLELYSEFNPIEKVIYHKKQGVFEMCQNFLQSQPDNLEYIIKILDSASSQNAHILAQLIRQSIKKGIQFNQDQAFDDKHLEQSKSKTLEYIEQLDSQKIFTYQLLYINPSDNQLIKIIQGYSDGFIKMMGATKSTFSSYVMKHRGFEPFSGKSRLDTVIMVLSKELGINPSYEFDNSAQIKTFDDYIISLTPKISIQYLGQGYAVVVSNFDINVNQLLKLESIRKKNNQQLLFQQDFRYQCQAQNFMEKFYLESN